MSKTRIPSPARSHGATTPRRYRPQAKKTKSITSPERSSRLTNMIEDAFQLSPVPTRRSVLNDDTDVQEPLHNSWWKNINENSRDMQELYKNMNTPVANNVLDDIDTEAWSPDQNFSIDIPDSSDGESIKSIRTPQRKNLLSHKETTKQNIFKNMKIIQQHKKTLLKNTDSDESINVAPKKLFNYTKDKSVPVIPPQLLQNLKNDCADGSSKTSIEMCKNKKSRNLFGNEPEKKRNSSPMDFNNFMFESEDEINEVNEKQVFCIGKPSSVKLSDRPSIQSDIDEYWNNLLPSSTMIESQSEAEMTPNNKRLSPSADHLQQNKRSRLMSTENVMDNTLINKSSESNNVSINKENSMDDTLIGVNNKKNSPEHKKTILELQNTPANHTLTLLNKSLKKKKNTTGNNSNQSLIQNDKKSILSTETNTVSENAAPAVENVNRRSNSVILSERLSKNKTRISEVQSDSSINNSVWDSHRITRKTLRQTFGKDFTPRKSLRTLVMEKSAKRHTVGNFLSGNLNEPNNFSIYQTNNAHKTIPSECYKYNETITPNDNNLGSKNYDNKQIKEVNQNISITQENMIKMENDDEKRLIEEIERVGYQSENGEKIVQTNEDDNVANNQTEYEKQIQHELDDEEQIVETDDDNDSKVNIETENKEQIRHQSDDNEKMVETNDNNEVNNQTKDDKQIQHQSDHEEEMVETNYGNELNNETEDEEQIQHQSDHEEEMVEPNDGNESNNETEDEEQIQHQSDHEEDMVEPNDGNESNNQTKDEEQLQHQSDNEEQNIIKAFDYDENEASNETDDEEQDEETNDDDDREAENQTKYENEEIVQSENEEIENQSKDDGQEEIMSFERKDVQNQIYNQEQSLETNDYENESDNETNDNNFDEQSNENMMATNNEESNEYSADQNDDESTLNQLHNNEDISEMPQANSTEYPVFESMAAHTQARDAVKQLKKNKQSKSSMQELIEQIKVENAERKQRFDAEVGGWLNSLKPQYTNTFFKVPQRPPIRRTKKPTESKPKIMNPADKMFLNILPPEFFEDIKYKPPKRYQPKNAAWANKHLYAFLEKKLEPKYDYRARIRAEKLVEKIYQFTQEIRRAEVAPEPAVCQLKQEMARLKVVNTHFDFYEFIIDFLPQEIRHKVVPCGVNLIPMPKPSVYSNILS